MVGLLSRQRRRAPRPSLVQGLALLYGRALHLPPAALPPLVPLVGASGAFVAALCTILWQRPSTPQMAHALDRRLGLREQIGSALELEPSSSRLAALLYQRTTAALESANPAYILPWPSLRRERMSLIILGLVAGLCALLAAHAPPPRQFAAAPTARTAAARHSGLARHHARTLPVKLLALGAASARPAGLSRPTTPTSPAMRLAAGQGGQARGRALPGSALSLHAGKGHGQGSPVSGAGSQAGANPLGTNRAGRAVGQGSTLHLA